MNRIVIATVVPASIVLAACRSIGDAPGVAALSGTTQCAGVPLYGPRACARTS